MLAKDLKKFGKFMIPVALAAWGLFYLVLNMPFLDIPAPLWWLGAVIGLAATLTGCAALYFRARERNKQRW